MSTRSHGPKDLDRELIRFRAQHPVRRVATADAQWHYLVGGAGPETVLYLPGGTGHAEAAFTSLAELERDYRVISVSYPVLVSMTALVDGIVSILDREQVDRAHVWGTSFGGMAAQVLVRRAPGRVLSLILSNSAVPDAERAERAQRQGRILQRLPSPVVRWLVGLAVGRQLRGLSEPEHTFWHAYLRGTLLADAKAATVNLSRLSANFYRMAFTPADLATWPGRILLLAAEDDELYRSMHEPMRRLYPQAEITVFPGGHAATVGHQGAYLAAVTAFLSRDAA